MYAFWPIFSAVIIPSQRCLLCEITLALNWKLIHCFRKNSGLMEPTLPVVLPPSSPKAKTLPTRRSSTSYHNSSKENGLDGAVYIGKGACRLLGSRQPPCWPLDSRLACLKNWVVDGRGPTDKSARLGPVGSPIANKSFRCRQRASVLFNCTRSYAT